MHLQKKQEQKKDQPLRKTQNLLRYVKELLKNIPKIFKDILLTKHLVKVAEEQKKTHLLTQSLQKNQRKLQKSQLIRKLLPKHMNMCSSKPFERKSWMRANAQMVEVWMNYDPFQQKLAFYPGPMDLQFSKEVRHKSSLL